MNMDCHWLQMLSTRIHCLYFISKYQRKNIKNEYGLTSIANVVNLYSSFIISILKYQKKNTKNEYGLTSVANVVNLYSSFIISKTSKKNTKNEYGLTSVANVVNLYSSFIILLKHQRKKYKELIWIDINCKSRQLVFIIYNFYSKTSKEKNIKNEYGLTLVANVVNSYSLFIFYFKISKEKYKE